MQPNNVREYENLRSELDKLRDCINTYVSFVLGGSGAALVGLLAAIGLKEAWFGVCLGALALALVITIIQNVLMYKFLSHNRYAGYCKLLSQEWYEAKSLDVFLWEPSLEQLRYSDFDNTEAVDRCRTTVIKGVSGRALSRALLRFGGDEPSADKKKRRRGAWIVFWAIRGHTTSASWGYPVYVVATLFIVTLLFWAVHAAFAFMSLQWYLGVLLLFLSAVLVGMMWATHFGRLSALMGRSRSIDAYCWKFMYFRFAILTSLGARSYTIVAGKQPWQYLHAYRADRRWIRQSLAYKLRNYPGRVRPR